LSNDASPSAEPAIEIGKLLAAGDRWEIRFERGFLHHVDTVWSWLTEPEKISTWFPQTVVGELAVGQTLRFESALPGVNAFTGEVTALERLRLLAFTWSDDLLTFELRATDDGTVLTFTASIGELGKAARDAAGWHTCLDTLAVEIEGTTPEWSSIERWLEVHSFYVDSFGEDAAKIGPPVFKD
jgi:uncharacterized protein YndB with AHSA1/START domain